MEYLKVAGKDQLFWNQTVLFLLNRWIRTNTADAKALSQIKVASLDLQTLHNYIPAWASTPNCSGFVSFFWAPGPVLERAAMNTEAGAKVFSPLAKDRFLGWRRLGALQKASPDEANPCWPLFVLVCRAPVAQPVAERRALSPWKAALTLQRRICPPTWLWVIVGYPQMKWFTAISYSDLNYGLYHTDLWFPPSTSSKGGVQAGNLPAKNAGPGRCWDLSQCSFEAIVQFLFLCGADFPFG